MNVPLLDLKAQYATIKHAVDAAVQEVLTSQQFILGPTVEACEDAIADYCSCAHAIGVSSGTDALLVSLMAESVGPGDEIITTPYTFFATGGCISRLGAKPVFVDIDADSYNINAEAIGAAITDRTKGIIPVHLYGQVAEMNEIMGVAEKHNLFVIEDAAQAIGAEYGGRRAGSIGHYGCLSFFPSKNLGAAGDGGMVVLQDKIKAERVKTMRSHGAHPKYYHTLVGGNFRLDALQAAVVHAKLPHLDAWTTGRQANAERYDRLIAESGAAIRTPTRTQSRHIYNQYVVRVPNRDAVRQHLKNSSVGCEVYYPVPLHLQECFSNLGYSEGDFPESESAANETLALPIYPELTEEQAVHVVNCLAEAIKTAP